MRALTCTHTRRYACTFPDAFTFADTYMHMCTRSAPAISLIFFSPGKTRGDAKSPLTTPGWRYASEFQYSQGRGVAPCGDLVSFLIPQSRQLSNYPFNLPRFNLLPRNSYSAKS